MAIELSTLTFTEQDDVVPESGVEKIVNTGISNALAGDDIINGETGNSGGGFLNPNIGLFNTGTLNASGGNDRITGIFNDPTDFTFNGYGIYNLGGIIDTGEGNDILAGVLDNPDYTASYQLNAYGIYNVEGIIDTGDGDDTIINTNNITMTDLNRSINGIYSKSI
jgi:hypothetical protein